MILKEGDKMNVKELLNEYKPDRFFILDSHQDAMSEQEVGHQHADRDYVGYAYNIHNYNQLTKNSFFLYRRPGKLADDHKFHIYGGGIIESISSPDNDGNVIARIRAGFKMRKSIDQGDLFIENFNWKTREKPGPGWKGFWLNYGMNMIHEEDFWKLIDERDCVKVEELNRLEIEREENDAICLNENNCTFNLFVNEESNMEKRVGEYAKRLLKKKGHVAKIDFDDLNRKNKDLGTAGELLALEYEQKRLADEKIPYNAEYVADTLGDGLGYDILSYDKLGKEIHIEVKTTRTSNQYGFFMSKNEIEESKNSVYKIYRVYNFDDEGRTADMKIIDGEVTESNFVIEATNFRISGTKTNNT